jgi:hypothetical protein
LSDFMAAFAGRVILEKIPYTPYHTLRVTAPSSLVCRPSARKCLRVSNIYAYLHPPTCCKVPKLVECERNMRCRFKRFAQKILGVLWLSQTLADSKTKPLSDLFHLGPAATL